MDYKFNEGQFDPFHFFSGHPTFVCQLISIYYPLTPDWMKKFGDILFWGGIQNCDISICADQDFYLPGIIFNKALKWDDEIRALVFANLAIRGGDLEIESMFWDHPVAKTKDSSFIMNDKRHEIINSLIQFVWRCPYGIDMVIESEAGAMESHYINEAYENFGAYYDIEKHRNAMPDYWESRDIEACRKFVIDKYKPTITRKLTTKELIELIPTLRDEYFLLKNPDLWHYTLSDIFTEKLTKQLLHYFYQKHSWGGEIIHCYLSEPPF